MKTSLAQTRRIALRLATVTSLILAGSLSVFAASSNQVARTTAVQTITASCALGAASPFPGNCPTFDPFVEFTEPAKLEPVVVTWSADYNTTGTSVVGLSLNGGRCLAYGPFTLQEPQLVAGSSSVTVPSTHQVGCTSQRWLG